MWRDLGLPIAALRSFGMPPSASTDTDSQIKTSQNPPLQNPKGNRVVEKNRNVLRQARKRFTRLEKPGMAYQETLLLQNCRVIAGEQG